MSSKKSQHVVIRYHDFCAGHRVVGHESKCRHLHGHNYRATFHVKALKLDELGRVIDFSVVKSTLCEWLEQNWDHKFLYWEHDEIMRALQDTINGVGCEVNCVTHKENVDHSDVDKEPFWSSLVELPFNPTAENLAEHLVEVVGPQVLWGTGVELVGIELSETRKCSVTYFKEVI